MPVADPTIGQTNWGTALNSRLDDIDLRAFQVVTPTASKTANYTAAVNDFVLGDVSAGSWTLTLPAAPADRAVVAFLVTAVSGTNTLTYAAGAGDTLEASLPGTANIAGQSHFLQYQSSTKIWRCLNDRTPIAALAGPSAAWTPTFTNVTSGAGTFKFLRVNKRLYVSGTFTGGTATAAATIALSLPTGNTAIATIPQPISAYNGGGGALATCAVGAAGTTITLWANSTGSNFTVSQALSGYSFNGVIEVQ